MDRPEIYLVFYCDEWKSRDSMRLCLATTDVERLKSFLAKKIAAGEFEYGRCKKPTGRKAASQFKEDFDYMDIRELNELEYAYIECVTDGEEQ